MPIDDPIHSAPQDMAITTAILLKIADQCQDCRSAATTTAVCARTCSRTSVENICWSNSHRLTGVAISWTSQIDDVMRQAGCSIGCKPTVRVLSPIENRAFVSGV